MTQARVNAARTWIAAMLATAVAVAFSFKHLDVPVAMVVEPWTHHLEPLGRKLAGPLLIAIEALVFLVLATTRITRGAISPLGKAVAAACISSICAYAVNSTILKPMFGVLPPGYVTGGWPHVAHFFQGNPDSSFPSGHMAMAGAFIGVLMRHYPKTVLPLAALLAGIGCLLIVGGWHFISDVLAGAFFGVSTGLFAAEVWLAHERRQSA
jgi:membrane-associated phospholipid phosphatase